MSLKDHPLFPMLLREFTADAPSMRATAHVICQAGFTVEAVLSALAAHAPAKMVVQGGRGAANVGFMPDYGMHYEKLAPTNCVLKHNYVLLEYFMRTDTGCWTVGTEVELGNVNFARSFDFPDTVFACLLNARVRDHEMRRSVGRVRAGSVVVLPVVAHLTSTVGEMVTVAGESYRPLLVKTATVANVTLAQALL